MNTKLTILALLLVGPPLVAQAPDNKEQKGPSRVCRLAPANPPNSNPYPFLPKTMDFTRINRFPEIAYVVNEDGSVSDVKILKGTGSLKVDAALVKSIQTWKYKPQPGCTFEMSMGVIIDIGS